jgi:hypothetical protein
MTDKEKMALRQFIIKRIGEAINDLYTDIEQMYDHEMDRPIDYCVGEVDAIVKLTHEITETVAWNLKQKGDN